MVLTCLSWTHSNSGRSSAELVHLCGSVGVCSSSGESWGRYVSVEKASDAQTVSSWLVVLLMMYARFYKRISHGRHHNHASDYCGPSTMPLATETIQPIKTAMIRSKGPLFKSSLVYGCSRLKQPVERRRINSLPPNVVSKTS